MAEVQEAALRGDGLHHRGFSARAQPAALIEVLSVKVFVPLAPAAGTALYARSTSCPPSPSQASVQPRGGLTVAVVWLIPTPPMSIAPGVTVVTLGTATLLTLPALSFVPGGVSNGVPVSTPWKSVIPPFHFCADESLNR